MVSLDPPVRNVAFASSHRNIWPQVLFLMSLIFLSFLVCVKEGYVVNLLTTVLC